LKNYVALITCCSFIGALFFGIPHARGEGPQSIRVEFPPVSLHFFDPFEAQIDTFHLARYSFDDVGLCTPQGWIGADRTSEYGDYAGLFQGVATLQEDPCYMDFTCVWGFFNNSTFDYACGGFPQQPAVPYQNNEDLYLSNEIWSPNIPIAGNGSNFVLSYRVYRDLPLENLVFYTWRVRSIVGGLPREWRSSGTYHYGNDKNWMQFEVPVGSLIEPGAGSVQIALGCHDLCGIWCGWLGNGICHSHAPLFDDVSFRRIDDRRPEWTVRYIDLFQDNFASDGTVTGTVRADAALDILPRANPMIRPGDSVCVTVSAFDAGLDYHYSADPHSGPAVYCHVKPSDIDKSGTAISGDPERWPAVSVENNWTVLQMDTAYVSDGTPAFNRFCIDLNDNLFTPGDTVLYFFSARDAAGRTSYWSRTAKGQGSGFTSTDMMDAISNAMEFTCLPAAGLATGDLLYVDDADDESVMPQSNFDLAFELLAIHNVVDRFDVLGASSLAGNGPGSRVVDVLEQIIPYYKIIIWNSGSLSNGLIGDGSGRPEKSPDAQFLHAFLDRHTSYPFPGLYISGNHVAEEWNKLNSGPIQNLKDFIDHALVNGDHRSTGESISPFVIGLQGSIFDNSVAVDTFVAYGGCPTIDRFDVLHPVGTSNVEMAYSGDITHAAVISSSNLNSNDTRARVLLSGFSFNKIRDVWPVGLPARADHLRDILMWFRSDIDCPVDRCIIEERSVEALECGIELNWDLGACSEVAEELRVYRDEDLLLATLPATQIRYLDVSVIPDEMHEYVLGVVLPPSGGMFCPVIPRREERIPLGDAQGIPCIFKLEQNFPNPFNSGTTIAYSIRNEGYVSIRIYNVQGRLIKSLVDENKHAKTYSAEWDGKNDNGDPVASGVYLYRMATAGFEQTKKMILLR
jgi:hypothetical protein